MGPFNITSFSSTAQSLGSFELGFVGRDGALVTGASNAVTMGDNSDLFVDGAIVASNGLAVTVYASGYVAIGQNGSVISTSAGAIDIANPGIKVIHNAGYVNGALWGIGWIATGVGNSTSLELLNSGTITGNIGVQGLADEARSVIDNSGIIQGVDAGMNLWGLGAVGSHAVTNTGTITGQIGIQVQFGTLELVNSGTIAGRSEGAVHIAISGGAGADRIVNTGTITGDVVLGGGADTLEGDGGRIFGTVFGGGGTDVLYGTDFRDRMSGGSSDDRLEFGGGNDVYLAGNEEQVATDGNDDIEGGDGIDTYDAGAITSSVTVRLHESRAVGSEIGHDLVLFFENAFGGFGNDTLVGDGGRNILRGNNGNDILNGLEGNDRLFGGNGTDTIAGNIGRDAMTGGADADIFDFNSTAETATGDSTRDLITDFVTGLDDIDLSTIDANTTLGGNQAFTFIGNGAFTSAAGQLRFVNFGGTSYTVVEGDVNGDGAADFSIGLMGTIALVAGDFVL